VTGRRLSIGELLDGGLALLIARPISAGLFILADASMAYGLLWAEARYELGLAAVIGISFIGYAVLSSFFTLALGERLGEVLADPAELFVRVVFVFATGLIVAFGAGLAFLLLIVPGLYVLARWSLVSPLILLQGAGIREALGRSWQLTEASVWSLVVVSVMVYLPQGLISFFGGSDLEAAQWPPTAGLAFELLATSSLVAFEVAVIVFTCRELAAPTDELTEVFA
jgi:hypothetical protein